MVARCRCGANIHTGDIHGDGYLYAHAIPAPHVHCKHGNSYGYEYCGSNAHRNSGHLPLRGRERPD